MLSLFVKESFKLGEKLTFLIKKDSTSDVNIVIFTYPNNLYIYYDTTQNKWKSSASLQTTTYTHSVFLNDFESNTFYYLVQIPSFVIPKPSFITIKVTDGMLEDQKTVSYGTYFTEPSLITVYGTLYDALGKAMRDKAVSFTVANTLTYTDNSPYSSMTAYTTTDENGYFEINLNRRYDYIASIPELNFSKLVKISNVPKDTNAVELIFSSTDKLC